MANNQQLLLGEGAGSAPAVYIEEVFSTYLYTGNGSTQTITNNIDLSTKGGLVWIKDRDSGAKGHALFDTARGVNLKLQSQSTNGEFSGANQLTAFNTTGFDLGSAGDPNGSGTTYASWTFRKQPKFFDVVTYTGDGTNNRAIAHSLGSAPGMIIVKNVTASQSWIVYHRSTGTGNFTVLNSTGAVSADANAFPSVSSTTFVPTANEAAFSLNTNATTFVAYLFAHDAGGFGLTGTDNVISCGSYTGTGAIGNTITLGYEPQWVMIKASSGTSALYQDWYIYDNMRGIFTGTSTNDPRLMANLSSAESSYPEIAVSATGFVCEATGARLNESGTTYIYIAIRRGPMKVPTVGTSVFNAITRTGTAAAATVTGVGFPPDLMIVGNKTGVSGVTGHTADRLRGKFTALRTNATATEISDSSLTTGFLMDGVSLGDDSYDYGLNKVMAYVDWFFRRAPGFFDEVCYTGTGVARTVAHNLAAVPEMMIVKRRNAANNWAVYATPLGNTDRVFINQTGATLADSTLWNNTTPTSSVFTVGTAFATNNSADTYVAYLFATCAGVSKVGSYTGTAAAQVINCGFTSGARFVLIKRTDDTGDWYVWDSARGIVAGNDPYLLLNSAAAEVTGTDYIDTDTTGFEISSTAPAAINASAGTFIFLAIA